MDEEYDGSNFVCMLFIMFHMYTIWRTEASNSIIFVYIFNIIL
jgi:hypothetical protein